jgi:hypothetical protein
VTPDAELRVDSDLTGDALPLLLAFFGGSPEAGEVQMQAGALPFDGAAGFRLCLPEESVWFAPLAEPHAERLPPRHSAACLHQDNMYVSSTRA